MEYIILDLDTATEEQITAALEYNSRTYRSMSSQVANLRKMAALAKQKSTKQAGEIKEELPATAATKKSTVDEEFEEEVDYYYSAVKELTTEQLEDELVSALPSRKNYDYERILKRIQAEIMRSCKDIRDFLATEELQPEDKAELIEELNAEIEKINAINRQLHMTEEEIIAQEQQTSNTLIFVPTSGGNIRVQDELDHIDATYYKKFETLLTSIKNGTFKGVKKLHGELVGLAEVKDRPSGTRIAFMRLDKNIYAIISAFVKKSDNSMGYQKTLSNHYQAYLNIESTLKQSITKPEFVEMHKGIEEEIFRKLNPNYGEKGHVFQKKSKVGE